MNIWTALFESVPRVQNKEPYGTFCRVFGRAENKETFVSRVVDALAERDLEVIDVDELENITHEPQLIEYDADIVDAVKRIESSDLVFGDLHQYPLD